MASSPKQRGKPDKAIVNLYEAKTNLSQLVDRASRGEEITIAKAGTPMARLVPIAAGRRVPGALKGKIRISADFDAPLPEDILSPSRDIADADERA